MAETHTERATRYWDAHRAKANDPLYWMAHPVCRQAINRRVTGSPDEWPLDWLKRVHAPNGFRRGISWGCGLGAFERSVVRNGLVQRIDAFDLSAASLADARSLAEKEGLTGIRYAPGNFDDPEIPSEPYDVAFFHASLHHVSALERLFRRLTLILKAGGAIYVDEYVGPSRDQWQREKLELAEAVLDLVPPEARLGGRIEYPIAVDDPSEAIRSSEIESFLRAFCDLTVWRPYGGQLVGLVLPYVSPDWAVSPRGHAAVEAMMKIEQYELARRPAATHHAVAFGTIKSLPRLLPPLVRQVGKAVRRRLRAAAERF